MSAPQPEEHHVDHGEVRRRDATDVTPAGPDRKPFSIMTAIMFGAVILAGIWFLATQLS